MKLGTLFTGIGGFDLGFARAGFECIWQVEIDRDCNKVLEARFPDARRINDVRKAGKSNLEPVDVIAFGWPCQDLSVAGLRAGLSGGRSGLFWEAVRIIGEIRPQIFVAENVPGLLSSWTPTEPPPFDIPTRDFHSEEEAQRWADGVQGQWDVEETSDFETVLIALGELGYGFSQRVLDAQYDNVAQRRERVFIVGSLGDGGGLPETQSNGKLDSLHFQVLFDEVSLSWDSAPSRETGSSPSAAITTGAGKSSGPRNGNGQPMHLIPDVAWALQERDSKGSDSSTKEGRLIVADCLTQNYGKQVDSTNRHAGPVNLITQAFAPSSHADYREGLGTLRAHGGDAHDGSEMLIAFSSKDSGADAGEIAPTLRAQEFRDSHMNGGGQVAIAFGWNKSASQTMRVDEETIDAIQSAQSSQPTVAFCERAREGGRNLETQEELAYAITNPGSGGRTHSRQIGGEFGVRRLTPTECMRLQGFPDWWFDDANGDKILSDSAMYRCLGNAVCANVAFWIGERIISLQR